MRTIYIDGDYKCHAAPGEGLRAVETEVFDGKCSGFVEGYRYVPEGECWVRSDGLVFRGEMAAPWKDGRGLADCQRQYESMLAEQQDMETALNVMGVTANG